MYQLRFDCQIDSFSTNCIWNYIVEIKCPKQRNCNKLCKAKAEMQLLMFYQNLNKLKPNFFVRPKEAQKYILEILPANSGRTVTNSPPEILAKANFCC